MNPSPPQSQTNRVQPVRVGREELTLHSSAAGLQTCMAWFHHLEQARRAELSILRHWTDDLHQAAQTMVKTSEPADLLGLQAELFGAGLAHAFRLHSELFNSWQDLQAALLEDWQINTQMDNLLASSAGKGNLFANAKPVPEQTMKWIKAVWATSEQLALGWATAVQPQSRTPD